MNRRKIENEYHLAYVSNVLVKLVKAKKQ